MSKPTISKAEASREVALAGAAARQAAAKQLPEVKSLTKSLQRPLNIPGLGELRPPALGHTMLMAGLEAVIPPEETDALLLALCLARPLEIYDLVNAPGDQATKAAGLKRYVFQVSLNLELADLEKLRQWLDGELEDIAGEDREAASETTLEPGKS